VRQAETTPQRELFAEWKTAIPRSRPEVFLLLQGKEKDWKDETGYENNQKDRKRSPASIHLAP